MRSKNSCAKKIDEQFAEVKEGQAKFEAEMYVNVAKEHLIANGQTLETELVDKMSKELAEALKNRTYEWKRPLPETGSLFPLNDMEQVGELERNFNLHMHDVLEQLGYGPYDPE